MIGAIGYLCGCDNDGDDSNSIFKKVPVDPRKRYVYNIHCPTGPGIDCPLVVDPTGKEYLTKYYSSSVEQFHEIFVKNWKYFASFSPKGAYFRRDGWSNHYLCGRSPDADEYEPEISNNDVDYEFFEENVWPVIANRAKCFENSKVGY